MQDVAYNLFDEINKVRKEPEYYLEEFGDYSETVIEELSLFNPEGSDKYVWNEGIARAA